MIKTTKKLTRKNSDDSKIKSDNRNKRTQNIVEKCINTENVMHIIINQKMWDVSIEQMLTLSRDKIVMQYKKLWNQQSKHEHMQR